jgi:peptidoglycan/xylan/chitin deacetylase (PgdA/CDA1 family)
MARLINRRVLAEILYRTGILHLAGWVGRYRRSGHPLILMGHRVLPESALNAGDDVDRMALLSSHALGERELERRLRLLLRLRPPGDPGRLADGLPAGRTFYLTFDDGCRDNLLYAAPVLRKLGLKAVVFLVGELVKRPDANPWWDRYGSEALGRCASVDEATDEYGRRCTETKRVTTGLTTEDLQGYHGRRIYLDRREIEQGLDVFYYGNHTLSHPNLTQLDAEEVGREIDEGQRILDGLPGVIPVLAYPFGFNDDKVIQVVRERPEIKLAVATGRGKAGDVYRLPRVNLNTQPFSLFFAECVGVYNVFHEFKKAWTGAPGNAANAEAVRET